MNEIMSPAKPHKSYALVLKGDKLQNLQQLLKPIPSSPKPKLEVVQSGQDSGKAEEDTELKAAVEVFVEEIHKGCKVSGWASQPQAKKAGPLPTQLTLPTSTVQAQSDALNEFPALGDSMVESSKKGRPRSQDAPAKKIEATKSNFNEIVEKLRQICKPTGSSSQQDVRKNGPNAPKKASPASVVQSDSKNNTKSTPTLGGSSTESCGEARPPVRNGSTSKPKRSLRPPTTYNAGGYSRSARGWASEYVLLGIREPHAISDQVIKAVAEKKLPRLPPTPCGENDPGKPPLPPNCHAKAKAKKALKLKVSKTKKGNG